MNIKRALEDAANEIRDQGIPGWGNTCDDAARRIRELEAAVHDLLITDKPAAWRLHLGESRYEEIKELEQSNE